MHQSSNNLDNNPLEYFPSRNNALVKENSHKSICSNWKTNDSLYKSIDKHYEVVKDCAWKKPNTNSFDELLSKSFHSHNKWAQERNHSSWNNIFKGEDNTSNNWVARGTNIKSSWSSNRKEKIIILMIVMKTQRI